MRADSAASKRGVRHFAMLGTTLLLACALAPPPVQAPELQWDRRTVEHLWNRAGFGIPDAEVDFWVDAGPVALVDHLLARRPLDGQTMAPRFEYEEPRIDPVEYEQRTIDERREYRRIRRQVHGREFERFRASVCARILDREDPLRDRMTLFWHSVFTSSYETVRHPEPIALQHQKLRDGALGSYEALLRAMLRDPAMLIYLDGDSNRKGKPNENLAREVMELFSLGEGSGYTEDDVREAARTLTGAGVDDRVNGGNYRWSPKNHDDGEKAILGDVGEHRPDDLASILVAQPACARFVVTSVIEYLEGVAPSEARVDEYAALLRTTDYDVGFMLRRLFLDPDFYRDEVVGARVASPVDFLAGSAIRAGLDVPPGFVAEAAATLGQDLFRPPNVKGWDEGLAWITTATFMQRGNIAGALLQRVDRQGMVDDAEALVASVRTDDEMAAMDAAAMKAMSSEQLKRNAVAQLVRDLEKGEYEVGASITNLVRRSVASDDVTDENVARALCESLLAVVPPAETVAMLSSRLADLRHDAAVAEPLFLAEEVRAEPILRELAHFVLSLPEAQIH